MAASGRKSESWIDHLSPRLKALGGIKRHFSRHSENNNNKESEVEEFKIVHFPDRPARRVTRDQIPPEEECRAFLFDLRNRGQLQGGSIGGGCGEEGGGGGQIQQKQQNHQQQEEEIEEEEKEKEVGDDISETASNSKDQGQQDHQDQDGANANGKHRVGATSGWLQVSDARRRRTGETEIVETMLNDEGIMTTRTYSPHPFIGFAKEVKLKKMRTKEIEKNGNMVWYPSGGTFGRRTFGVDKRKSASQEFGAHLVHHSFNNNSNNNNDNDNNTNNNKSSLPISVRMRRDVPISPGYSCCHLCHISVTKSSPICQSCLRDYYTLFPATHRPPTVTTTTTTTTTYKPTPPSPPPPPPPPDSEKASKPRPHFKPLPNITTEIPHDLDNIFFSNHRAATPSLASNPETINSSVQSSPHATALSPRPPLTPLSELSTPTVVARLEAMIKDRAEGGGDDLYEEDWASYYFDDDNFRDTVEEQRTDGFMGRELTLDEYDGFFASPTYPPGPGWNWI